MTCHFLDVVGEPPVPVHVHDGDELAEGDKGEPRGPEAVEHREPVLPGPGGEHEADHEAADADDGHKEGLLHLQESIIAS